MVSHSAPPAFRHIHTRAQNTLAIPLYGAPRNGQTLTDIITHFVDIGSVVCTDGFAAYQAINPVYDHRVVDHNANFVNPNDPNAHTQTVESSNVDIRTALPAKGIKGAAEDYGWYIAGRYMYKRLVFHEPLLAADRDAPGLTLLRHFAAWWKLSKPAVHLGMNLVYGAPGNQNPANGAPGNQNPANGALENPNGVWILNP